jgi:molybdate transport system regulatory protein
MVGFVVGKRRRGGKLQEMRDGMTNRYEAEVESISARAFAAHLRIGRTRLIARPWPGLRTGGRVHIRIRPEEVLLATHHPGVVSARNVLAGHVLEVKRAGDGAYVRLGVGFPLVAFISPGAVDDLGVRRGLPLFAVVKAPAIVPEIELAGRFRVAAIGAKGLIPTEHLDLLREIEATGSMTRAAREVGVTARTADAWVEAAAKAWGRPLVATERGGKGGGGAALTPEGVALLESASALEQAQDEILERRGAPRVRPAARRRKRKGGEA